MVESGVPSSCAAAAARPSSALSCSRRDSASSVARQRVGELPGFVGHPVGIGGDEDHAAEQRHPDADDIDPVEDDALVRIPRQRQVPDGDAAEAMTIASAARMKVERCGSVVAETETGASSSSENGFCKPAGQRQQAAQLAARS